MKAIHVLFLMFISFCAQGYASDLNPYAEVHKNVMQHIFGAYTELPEINTQRFTKMLAEKNQEEQNSMAKLINTSYLSDKTTPLMRRNLAIWYAVSIGSLTQQQINTLKEVQLTHTIADLKVLLFWLPKVNYLCHVAKRSNPTNPLTHFELILIALNADSFVFTDQLDFMKRLFILFEAVDKRLYLEEYYFYTRGFSGTKKIQDFENYPGQTDFNVWELLDRLLGKTGRIRPNANPYDLRTFEQQIHHEEDAINALVNLAILEESKVNFVIKAAWFMGHSHAECCDMDFFIPSHCWKNLVPRMYKINRIVSLLNQQGVKRENLAGYLITIESKEHAFSNLYYLNEILLNRQQINSIKMILNMLQEPDLNGEMHSPVQRTEECARGGMM